jgi:hypothetical protein
MARSGKSLLIAGVLVAVAGSAYATDPQQAPQATQQSYTPGPAMSTAAPAIDQTSPDRFLKPPGYDQDPWMAPYSRPGYGPKLGLTSRVGRSGELASRFSFRQPGRPRIGAPLAHWLQTCSERP